MQKYNFSLKYSCKFIICYFCLFALQSFSQGKFSKWSFDYQYNLNATLYMQHVAVIQKDSVEIYLKLQINKSVREYISLIKQSSWTLGVRICDSYESKNSNYETTLFLNPYKKNENLVYLKFKVPIPQSESAFLFIGISTNSEEFVIDIPIKSLGEFLISSSFLTNTKNNEIVFDRYLKSKDTLFLTEYGQKNNAISYYKYSFQAANPPMAENASYDAGLNLEVDSTFEFSKNTIIIPKKGNYSIGKFSDKLNFVAFDNKFPKPSKIKELIEPIIYIASDAERSAVKLASKPKLNLDEFWMKLGLNKEKTRKMIREYYNQVLKANIFFSGHKEGWKMDKGMIFIIFGPPEQVLKTDVSETWYYQKSFESMPIRFLFIKKLSPFGDIYYELQNNNNYTTWWYKSIEIWRRGDNFR